MAHFALLDENNTVTHVIVISNADIIGPDGEESESMGIDLCKRLVNPDGVWIQTSYNNNFRKTYASVGFKYSFEKDVFYNPVGPYPSWVLDDNYDWIPPFPPPFKDATFRWDEETVSWIELSVPAEESNG